MPTGKSRDKRTSGIGANNHGVTSGHLSDNQRSNRKEGGMSSMPEVPTARQRAKDMDAKRRADAESNGL